MARICLFTGLLDPEYAFEDVQETVETNLGMLDIDGYKHSLYLVMFCGGLGVGFWSGRIWERIRARCAIAAGD